MPLFICAFNSSIVPSVQTRWQMSVADLYQSLYYVNTIFNRKLLNCSDWDVTFWSRVERMSIWESLTFPVTMNVGMRYELPQFREKMLFWNLNVLTQEQLGVCVLHIGNLLLLHYVRNPQPLRWEDWWLQGYFWNVVIFKRSKLKVLQQKRCLSVASLQWYCPWNSILVELQ